jgi:hypothetical protein
MDKQPNGPAKTPLWASRLTYDERGCKPGFVKGVGRKLQSPDGQVFRNALAFSGPTPRDEADCASRFLDGWARSIISLHGDVNERAA